MPARQRIRTCRKSSSCTDQAHLHRSKLSIRYNKYSMRRNEFSMRRNEFSNRRNCNSTNTRSGYKSMGSFDCRMNLFRHWWCNRSSTSKSGFGIQSRSLRAVMSLRPAKFDFCLKCASYVKFTEFVIGGQFSCFNLSALATTLRAIET